MFLWYFLNMSEVILYDVDGKTYSAIMVDNIPEIPEMDNYIRRTSNFNFQVRIKGEGVTRWLLNGERHRLDGPAEEYEGGDKVWYVMGKVHRLGGPAVEYANGAKEWFVNNKRHRLDGPAIEYEGGKNLWWINDCAFLEEDFPQAVKEFLNRGEEI